MIDRRWRGVYPEVPVPFEDDLGIDEDGFRRLLRGLAQHEGIRGVTVNGRTGEVDTLLPEERAEIVRIAVDELAGSLAVVSAVSAEGTIEAGLQARAAEQAGADAILLLPPRSWLGGRQEGSAVGFVAGVAEEVGVPLLLHNDSTYSLRELLELAALPAVEGVALATADMPRYEAEVRALRSGSPRLAILSCHDAFLLPALVQGLDGVLAGIVCLVPGLVVALVRAVEEGDLAEAVGIYDRLSAQSAAVYRPGEPWQASLARLKEAAARRGAISSPVLRPPGRPLTRAERDDLYEELARCELTPVLSPS